MYSRTKAYQPRTKNGWKKRPKNNSSFGRKRSFSNTININRFINKVEKEAANETVQPRCSFVNLDVHDVLKTAIANHGFATQTPIQSEAIPPILAGKDVIGLANTGTGKTAAFLIPMINKILNNPKEKVLIIVPIRELALQIQEDFRALTRNTNLTSTVVVGGASIQTQMREIQRRPNVVIGTPGRLKDLITRKRLNLSVCNNVILDEADRMLDMGFISDVKLFLSLVSSERQTLMFSATFSKEIENLVQQFLVDPVKISLRTSETPKLIDQDIVRIPGGKDKIDVLHDLLNKPDFEKVLVFTRTKYGADKLTRKLYNKGFRAEAIHGGKSQNKRQSALNMFKKSSIKILVATDVAARGLDIPNVSHVINYDIPATYDDYVHRIGRTGRADRLGIALTFVS